MRLSLVVAFALAFPSFAIAADPVSSSVAPSAPTSSELNLVSVADTLAVQARDKERADWNARLERAQEDRKKGLRYFLIGLGVGAGGSILAVSMVGDDLGSTSSASTIAALSSLAGGGIGIYGLVKWFSATGDIDDLDREGRQKGYLTLIPMREGLSAHVNFRF